MNMDEGSQNHTGQLGPPGSGLNVGGKLNQDDINQRPQYSIPGILHFIQHEWTRFEMERSQWEVERAELQARIAFLQGERKGQENLKNDLIRRIKMLEYALKQERAKFYRLKYGTEPSVADLKAPMFDDMGKDEPMDGETMLSTNNVSWRQGRQLLRQYLQEIGYTDTIIDVRSARVRTLLGLAPTNVDGDDKQIPTMNGDPPLGGPKRPTDTQRRVPSKKSVNSVVESALMDAEASVLATFDFLASENVDMDEEDENLSDEMEDVGMADDDTDERIEGKRLKSKPKQIMDSSRVDDGMADAETEEVLSEFDFLGPDSIEGAGEARSHADGTEWESSDVLGNTPAWGGDSQALVQSLEAYRWDSKKQRKGHRHVAQRPKRSALHAMVASLSPMRINTTVTNESELMESEPVPPTSSYFPSPSPSSSSSPTPSASFSSSPSPSFTPSSSPSFSPSFSPAPPPSSSPSLSSSSSSSSSPSLSSSSPSPSPSSSSNLLSQTLDQGQSDYEQSGNFKNLHFANSESQGFGTFLGLPSSPSPGTNNHSADVEPTNGVQGVLNPAFPAGSRRPLMSVPGTEDDALEAALGLGELAGLTVNNEADTSYDISATKEAFRKTWNAKYTLRSHFDGVRALAFHPVEPVLVTASEDHTLKLWNLQKTVPAKKTASLDVEPVYTFRAHLGPVLCLAMSATGEQCFSGGLDSTIRCWNMPSSNIDPYDSFDPSVLSATLKAHTDAVWGLSIHNSKLQLLSCSADGTVRLWSPQSKVPLLHTYSAETEDGNPTSVDFVPCDPSQMVAGYSSSNTLLFDLETGKPILRLDSNQSPDLSPASKQINRVVSHPTLPMTITAHEDRHIRFFDNNTGKMVHSMVAHLDAVTSLAIDPNGLYLLSGSHDCSIRLWNVDNKTCVQEITSHRKKFDEAIFDVTFHPSKPYIASAGADALAKVFV